MQRNIFIDKSIPIIQQIRKDLKQNIDPKTQKNFQRFFKEEVKCYGVKTGTVGKIAKKHWKEVSVLDKKTIFSLCEELYQSDYNIKLLILF